MIRGNPKDETVEEPDLPLEFLKLRGRTIFVPLLTTGMFFASLGQVGGSAPNYVLAAVMGATGLAALWGGAISQMRQTEKLRRYLQVKKL